jgi:hypothetical protein
MLGVNDKAKKLLASCSEYGGAKKVDVDNKKEEFIIKIKEANVRAVNEAAHKVRVQNAEAILAEEFDNTKDG